MGLFRVRVAQSALDREKRPAGRLYTSGIDRECVDLVVDYRSVLTCKAKHSLAVPVVQQACNDRVRRLSRQRQWPQRPVHPLHHQHRGKFGREKRKHHLHTNLGAPNSCRLRET
ncbi:hypothetical protein NDU88_000761 [Pleurodeles waltl]|uniref:Uncharacterized protein n=1 Tax=Pleurodeles waltl TaxID=8319 RepID=A0AAV7WKL4_PLEWA|nr:hypothetical protein NDU88_000761 [Pleurodeles waltl]